jgi:hypothetical protein
MKTNKSRRIKKQSRFRNTRNKRKVSKRQRGGGDINDEKFAEMKRNTWKTVYFTYNSTNFTGEILADATSWFSTLLVIGNLRYEGIHDGDSRNLIKLFGTQDGDFIKLKKPSSYWDSEKNRIATDIINTMTFKNPQQHVSSPMYDDL